jgi:hypothetical protein
MIADTLFTEMGLEISLGLTEETPQCPTSTVVG